jgi:hypothetical protein
MHTISAKDCFLIRQYIGYLILNSIFIHCVHAISPYALFEVGSGKILTQSFAENNTPYNKVSNGYGFAYRLGGGLLWQSHPVALGLESSYATYPKNIYQYAFSFLNAYGEQTYNGQAVDILLQARLSLLSISKKPIFLIAKIGPAIVQQTYNGQASAFSTHISEGSSYTAIKPEVVASIAYPFNPSIEAQLNYHKIFAELANPNGLSKQLNPISSVEYFSAGLNFYFLNL